MKEFCLIGYPLTHSISPEIHDFLFKKSAVEGRYDKKNLAPGDFDGEIGNLRKLDGFNITIPYKQRILPYIDVLDERAARYNAVNTVKCENGRLYGYNTDADGFLRALEQSDIRLEGNVLLCGAGGVAHMMAGEALAHGCSLVIATPTLSESKNCVSSLQEQYPDAKLSVSTLAYLSGSFDLILNGTPSGMYPDVKSFPVPAAVARSAKAVFDAVYNPAETQLMRLARSAGANVQGGLPMLVWQAAAAQEIWTGAHFKNEDIEELCGKMAELLANKF